VCGDWDSIDADSEAYYRAQGCAMLATPEDQDSTDLVKCLREVARRRRRRFRSAVV
jgi:thiamine pyrophosphokinase